MRGAGEPERVGHEAELQGSQNRGEQTT